EGWFYSLAPVISFIPAMLTFAIIPFGEPTEIFGHKVDLILSDLNIGLLFFFAVTSLSVYGVMLAGWSSGSKYSLLGALRASAQMVSYEVAYGLSIIGVALFAQTLSLQELVAQQDGFWNMYVWKQPVGFAIFMICAVAETNRAPFDLAEAESELVAGFHTEYSSMRFATFFIGEYASMIAVGAIATTVFFGGWQPLIPGLDFIPSFVWFALKVGAFMFFYIWLRATLPRFRYDQLMNFGWKVLFPLALVNAMVAAAIIL
ncbi:MAG: NADH-quinone oxidoreductase subunit H, partial [Candidatus Zixiibacteriota bacterium]